MRPADFSLRSRRDVLRAGAAALAGCVAGATALSARADERHTLRMGFQKAGGLLGLLKAQGGLEARLASRGWSVTWHEFPAGPQLLEALDAGSVDFGYTGAPPPIFAQAADKDIVYVGAEPGAPHIEAIVVKPGSRLAQVSDLKGKRVAVQKGSSSHFLLIAALEHAGLGFAEIQPVYLPPADARAAFESDRVDAWTIWDPYLAAVQASAKVRVLADYTQLLRPHSFYESSRRFASESPQLLTEVLDLIAATGVWASAHPDQVAASLAPALGLPVDVLEVWQRRMRYGVQPVDAAVVATQQQIADTFFRNKLIPKPIEVARNVWRAPRA